MEEEKDVNDYRLHYENINRSRGNMSLNHSQNSLKRPNKHFPSHKQPKQLRTSYLLDKRNQFNLAPLKDEEIPDTQEKNTPYESSTYDKPSDNSQGGYYWVPRSNVSDNRWNVESSQRKSIDGIHDTSMTNDTYKNSTDNERSEKLSSGTEEKSVPNDSTDSKTIEIEKSDVDVAGKYGVDKMFGGKFKRGKLGNAGYDAQIIDKVYGNTEYRKNIEGTPALRGNYNDDKVDVAISNSSYNGQIYGGTEYRNNIEGSPALYEKLSVNYYDDKVDVATANNRHNGQNYGSMEYGKNIEGSHKLSVNYYDDKVDITTANNSYDGQIFGNMKYRKTIEGNPAFHGKLSVNYNNDKGDITTANNSYNGQIYGNTEYRKNIEGNPALHEKLSVNYNDNRVDNTAYNSYNDKIYGSTEYRKNIEDSPALHEKIYVNYNDDKVDVTTNDCYNDKIYGSTEYRQNIEDGKLDVEEDYRGNTALKCGVDKKFGGKYKRKIVISENKFNLNRPSDTRSDFDKATHRFEGQRAPNSSYSEEKTLDNYSGSTSMPKQNHIVDSSLLRNQSMNSKIEGKNDRLADKERIKQILIDHANKSAQKVQIQAGNSTANINDIQVSNDRKPLSIKSTQKGQIQAGYSSTNINDIQVSNDRKPLTNKFAQKGQMKAGNSTANINDIRISNDRKHNVDQTSSRSCKTSLSKGVDLSANVRKPATTSAFMSNVISTSNEKIVKPLLVSSINNPVLSKPITNGVNTIPAIFNLNQSNNPSTSGALIPSSLMNMNTTNVRPNVLDNASAIRNTLMLAKVLNPLIKNIPSNPVINRALQLMPGTPIPIDNSLLLGQNSMRAPSLIRHPILNNIRIPFNQRSPLLPNQNVQLNNLANIVFNPAQRFSLGRFR